MRAAGVVCDVVTLQKLLEFLQNCSMGPLSLLMMWGRPNSVTMVAISAQTAADEELANFLTRKYFGEYISDYEKVHSLPVEDICCQCVPWKRWKFLSGSNDGLGFSMLLANDASLN